MTTVAAIRSVILATGPRRVKLPIGARRRAIPRVTSGVAPTRRKNVSNSLLSVARIGSHQISGHQDYRNRPLLRITTHGAVRFNTRGGATSDRSNEPAAQSRLKRDALNIAAATFTRSLVASSRAALRRPTPARAAPSMATRTSAARTVGSPILAKANAVT